MKIVINKRHSGFSLSEKALALYRLMSGRKNIYDWDIERNDPILIKIVETLGKESWGSLSQLRIVNIPDDVEWEIDEYDGLEWVSEKHRTWD